MEPGSLSLIKLFADAGPLVKGALLVLVGCAAWAAIAAGECVLATRRLGNALARLQAGDLAGAGPLGAVFAARADEADRIVAGETVGERRERIVGTARRQAADLLEKARGDLPSVAVVAWTAPLIGLLATIWGTMTSISGLAAAKNVDLALIAPGLVEALAASALGVAIAILAAFAHGYLKTRLARLGAAIEHQLHEELPSASHPLAGEAPARREA